MSNQLQNICVFIEDEKQLQEARELLERYNQPIANDRTFCLTEPIDNYLQLGGYTRWWLSSPYMQEHQITLTELEKLLEQKGE